MDCKNKNNIFLKAINDEQRTDQVIITRNIDPEITMYIIIYIYIYLYIYIYIYIYIYKLRNLHSM